VTVTTSADLPEFMFYLKAFRVEEKKMVEHIRFEEAASKYW